MKSAAILSLVLSGLFTVSALFSEKVNAQNSSASATEMSPTAAATSEIKLEPETDNPWSQLNPRIVPQIGMSSMGYSAGGAYGQGFAGGVTTELGQTKARLVETGILFVQSNGQANIGPGGAAQTVSSSAIGIPLMAKIRFIESNTQSWYVKFGATTEFQTASNQDTSNFDVLAGAGVGARLPVSKKMDLLMEATYNRGMIDALHAQSGVAEGLLFFTGLSIAL